MKSNFIMVLSQKSSEVNNGDGVLDNTHHFNCPGVTITINLSLDKVIDIRIDKAAMISNLDKKEWNNINLRLKTKARIYQAFALGTPLYCSET